MQILLNDKKAYIEFVLITILVSAYTFCYFALAQEYKISFAIHFVSASFLGFRDFFVVRSKLGNPEMFEETCTLATLL